MKSETAFNKVTARIISSLENDDIPWRKPFNVSMEPMNGATEHTYRGINAWLLGLFGFDEPFFFGFKQINEKMDGLIKSGEKGLPIRFPAISYRDQKTGKKISEKKPNS
jgi:antirestriction protein ArdC